MAKKEREAVMENAKEMSLEESKAYRASLYKPEARALSGLEKREQFRIFWAKEKKKYDKPKELEQILWVHLKAVKLDDPEKFEAGLKHFGLKKVR
jgi:hypothetical protein